MVESSWSVCWCIALVGCAKLERGADRAGSETAGQPLHDGRDGLDAGAVLRDDTLHVEPAKGVDDPRDALVVEAAQVEAADHRMHLGDAGEPDGIATDADDTAVRARR